MDQTRVDIDTTPLLSAEIKRLKKALQVCMHTLHLREPTPAEEHAAQYASGAWLYPWAPEDVRMDLPDFKFED